MPLTGSVFFYFELIISFFRIHCRFATGSLEVSYRLFSPRLRDCWPSSRSRSPFSREGDNEDNGAPKNLVL